MYELGFYYNCNKYIENTQTIKEDFVLNFIKYHTMASENGHQSAMTHLGNYYKGINDIYNMKKYYLMAIEKGDNMAMKNPTSC